MSLVGIYRERIMYSWLRLSLIAGSTSVLSKVGEVSSPLHIVLCSTEAKAACDLKLILRHFVLTVAACESLALAKKVG